MEPVVRSREARLPAGLCCSFGTGHPAAPVLLFAAPHCGTHPAAAAFSSSCMLCFSSCCL
jgi:hypothetical protein